MPLPRILILIVAIFGVALGAGFAVSEVWGATSQIFQAGGGYEITTDNATQNLDITTKVTDGGAINITARSTGNAIFVDTNNEVGIGTTAPGSLLDVASPNTTSGYWLDGKAALTGETADNWLRLNQSSSWTNGVYTPIVFRVDGEFRQGSADAGAYGIQTGVNLYVGGTGTFVSTVSVGTPTAAGHATTRSWVESAISAVGNHWALSGSDLYASSTSYQVVVKGTSASTAPGTALTIAGSETTNRVVVDGGGPFIQLANRGWSGTAGILFSAYATSSYANGGLTTTGNTKHRYVAASFGGPDHRAKAIITDHTGIGFYISGVSPGADQSVTWSDEFNIGPTYTYILSNNLGIGTTTPAVSIKSTGQIHADTSATPNLDSSTYELAGNNIAGQTYYAYGSICAGNAAGTCGGNGGVTISAAGLVGTPAVAINTTGNSYFNSGGNVGIGTTTPAVKLDVVGGTIRGNSGLTITAGAISLPATSISDAALSANVSLLGNSITGGEIVDNTIEEVDLEATNAPTDNYVLSFDLATGGFTWVVDSAGTGDIEGVTAGNQLTGGGTSGTVTLNVSEGAGSGLDADVLDGINSTSFIRGDIDSAITDLGVENSYYSGVGINTGTSDQATLEIFNGTVGNDAFMQFHVSGDYALYFGLDGATNDLSVGGWSMGANKYRVWHAGNDGASSGLDADLLDGNSSAYFAPLASPSFTGDVTIGGDAIVSGNDLKFGGGAWVTGSGASTLQFLPNSVQDTAYEWVGFYSGATRQAIILWDAAWCTASATDVCFVAENSQRLVLQSGTTEVFVNDATLTVGDGATSKINVGTVDPLYTIGGKRYATYMAGMTGVKEETTGVVKLVDGEYALDLVSAEEGSDLWLFGHSINVTGRAYISHSGEVRYTSPTKLFDRMSVLVTPSFKGEVWYEKDVEGKRVVIHGSKDGEVSYRLTAPRFDTSDWGNRADSEHKGFNLDELLQEN